MDESSNRDHGHVQSVQTTRLLPTPHEEWIRRRTHEQSRRRKENEKQRKTSQFNDPNKVVAIRIEIEGANEGLESRIQPSHRSPSKKPQCHEVRHQRCCKSPRPDASLSRTPIADKHVVLLDIHERDTHRPGTSTRATCFFKARKDKRTRRWVNPSLEGCPLRFAARIAKDNGCFYIDCP